MSFRARSLLRWLLVCASVAAAGCSFQPDYSRYPKCGEDGTCPRGSLCWDEERVCLPACGEQPAGADGLCAGIDDGGAGDAGPEDGGGDGGAPLRLDALTLPAAIELEPYPPPDGGGVAFTASGGAAPYAFELAEGALPEGVTLSDGGVLTGTPTEAGSYPFTVRVTDAASAQQTRAVSLEVSPLLRIASNDPLPSADSGDAYNEQLLCTGGSGKALSWSYVSGAFPANMMMTSGGLITTGPNTASGSGSTFTVSVTDPGPPAQTRTRTFTLSVNLNPLGLGFHILTNTLPDGRLGQPYSYRLKAGGGSNTPTWVLTSAAPPGLTLTGDTLQGTPSARGDFTVDVKATSGLSSANRSFALKIW